MCVIVAGSVVGPERVSAWVPQSCDYDCSAQQQAAQPSPAKTSHRIILCALTTLQYSFALASHYVQVASYIASTHSTPIPWPLRKMRGASFDLMSNRALILAASWAD